MPRSTSPSAHKTIANLTREAKRAREVGLAAYIVRTDGRAIQVPVMADERIEADAAKIAERIAREADGDAVVVTNITRSRERASYSKIVRTIIVK